MERSPIDSLRGKCENNIEYGSIGSSAMLDVDVDKLFCILEQC